MAGERRRGVVASREKVESALHKAGFQSQVEVARFIADKEGLDQVPKDMVSKVFRQKPVSAFNLRRVASALGVEVKDLLLKQENEPKPSENLDDPEVLRESARDAVKEESKSLEDRTVVPSGNERILAKVNWDIWKVGALSLVCLLMGFGIYHFLTFKFSDSNALAQVSFPRFTLPPTLNQYHITVVSDPAITPLTNRILEQLSSRIPITFRNEKLVDSDDASLWGALSKYKTDALLKVDSIDMGRFSMVTVDVYSSLGKVELWQAVLPVNRVKEVNSQITKETVDFINAYFDSGSSAPESLFHQSVSRVALTYYLEGRSYLDTSYQNDTALYAQSRFSSAIRQSPDFSLAWAGLCQALLLESWTGEENEILSDAKSACEKALELNGEEHYVKAVYLALLRKIGNPTKIQHYVTEEVRDSASHEVELMYQKMALAFDIYNENKEQTSKLDEVYEISQQIINEFPLFWRVYNFLSLVELDQGNLDSAIQRIEKAVELNKNELLLANLGTFKFCQANITQAKVLFLELIKAYPASHHGQEKLGMVYYYENDFEKALEAKLKAIELSGQANIHQIWGNIADIYSKLKQHKLARDAYAKALEILKSDQLKRGFQQDDVAFELYYEVMSIDEIELDEETSGIEKVLDKIVDDQTYSPAASLRAALIAKKIHSPVASELTERAVEICPVYAKTPGISENIDNSVNAD